MPDTQTRGPLSLANRVRRFFGAQTHHTHDRANGPVVIDPDARERITVVGSYR